MTFIAMNRFEIRQGFERAFEDVWRGRDSHLATVPGFESFSLLKGPFNEEDNTTLYASHTVWESEMAFREWTKSEHFRKAHANSGSTSDFYQGHPNFEGFHKVEGA